MTHADHNTRVRGVAMRLAGLAMGTFVTCAVLTTSDATLLFGWQRLAVVQVVMSLPLGLMIARLSRDCGYLSPTILRALVWSVVAGAIAGCGIIFVPTVATILADSGSSFTVRALARSLLTCSLTLPWCLASESLAARRTGETTSWLGATPAERGGLLAVLVVVAMALPAAYASDLCRRQATRCSEALRKQQLVVAQRMLKPLRDLGSSQEVAGESPRYLYPKLSAAIGQLEERAAHANRSKSDAARACESARVLAMLDRLDEAEQVLTPHCAGNAQASLLLAAVLQQQGRWEESTARYEAADRLLREAPQSAEMIAGQVRALNGIAFNARETAHHEDAENVYLQGLARLPDAAAHFHFQLGRHYQLGGRPFEAIAHLHRAAELDPQAYQESASAILAQLGTESPGCVIGPWQRRNSAKPGEAAR